MNVPGKHKPLAVITRDVNNGLGAGVPVWAPHVTCFAESLNKRELYAAAADGPIFIFFIVLQMDRMTASNCTKMGG